MRARSLIESLARILSEHALIHSIVKSLLFVLLITLFLVEPASSQKPGPLNENNSCGVSQTLTRSEKEQLAKQFLHWKMQKEAASKSGRIAATKYTIPIVCTDTS